jgi:hypothetical protein
MPKLHGPLHYAPAFGKVYLRHIFAPSRLSAELCNYSAGAAARSLDCQLAFGCDQLERAGVVLQFNGECALQRLWRSP